MTMRCQMIDKTAGLQNMSMQRVDVSVWDDGGITLDDCETGERYLQVRYI